MARKTIEVEWIKKKVNLYLAGEHSNEEQRKTMAIFLEGVLHKTGNYDGFQYLDWIEGGRDRWVAEGQPHNTSDYIGREWRRVYY